MLRTTCGSVESAAGNVQLPIAALSNPPMPQPLQRVIPTTLNAVTRYGIVVCVHKTYEVVSTSIITHVPQQQSMNRAV